MDVTGVRLNIMFDVSVYVVWSFYILCVLVYVVSVCLWCYMMVMVLCDVCFCVGLSECA